MDWNDEEVEEAWMAWRSAAGVVGPEKSLREAMCRVMTRAVELAAARFNTMTVETLRYALRSEDWGGIEREFARHGARLMSLSEQIGAKEARVAVLEAQVLGEGGKFLAEVQRADQLQERLTAAEEANRELVRRAQQAEANLEHERRNMESWRRMADRMRERWEDAQARCATLSAAGQVLSAHVDCKTGEPVDRAPGSQFDDYGRMRYPCSPTCTHSDAATPGHPERSETFTKEAVEAFDGCKNDRERVCYAAGRERGLDEGAEAMRAACLEAASVWARKNFGIMPQGLKAAIEGAGP